MKSIERILALVLMLVLMSGCGDGNAPETTAPAETMGSIETTVPPETTLPPATTVPAETTVPTESPETEPAAVQVELSEKGRYEINIFLSNFSEQQFRDTYWYPESDDSEFRSADADVYEILFFVWNNLNYNSDNSESIEKDGNYYTGIPLDSINARSERFFGRSLTKEDVENTGGDFRMIKGMVCRPEAFGDTYMEMTVVDALYDLGDGTMRAEFTVYTPTIEAEIDGITSTGGINSKEIYYYTPEQVVKSGYFEPYRKGVALVVPKTLSNGRESYELVTYELLGEI